MRRHRRRRTLWRMEFSWQYATPFNSINMYAFTSASDRGVSDTRNTCTRVRVWA